MPEVEDPQPDEWDQWWLPSWAGTRDVEDDAVLAADLRAVDRLAADLPKRCVLLFGQEGPGLTPQARAAAAVTVSVAQFGSTRSINAGVAAGIAMHAWVRRHADLGAAR